MPTVTNTVRNAVGLVVPNATVTILLITTGANEPGFTTDGTVVGPYTTTTDANGVWSISIPGNSTITPTGTYYQVTEHNPAIPAGYSYYISVPGSGGPYQVGSILVQAPPSPGGTFIASTQKGAPNGVATLDATGNVPADQLANAPGGGGGGTPSGTVTSETSYGLSPSAGAATGYSRGDHTHGSPSLTSSAPTASAVGDVASAGAGSTPARSDHTHGRESFGAVAAQTTYGQASGSGSAATVAHSDHTHGTPALTSSAPTTSAVGDSAAVGTGTTPARSDHTHGREAFGAVSAQTTYGAASSNGTAATVAHSDHTHGTPSLASVAASTSAVGDSATVGVATTPARADHSHGREAFGNVAAQTAYGASSSNGAAATVSRSDHTHGTPPLPYAVLAFSQSGTITATAGTARIYNDSGRTLTVQAIRASAGTAPTGANLVVDILKNGSTIYTTTGNRPTIVAGTNTSGKAAAPDVTTIADGEYYTVTVVSVGSTVAGADLTVQIWAA